MQMRGVRGKQQVVVEYGTMSAMGGFGEAERERRCGRTPPYRVLYLTFQQRPWPDLRFCLRRTVNGEEAAE